MWSGPAPSRRSSPCQPHATPTVVAPASTRLVHVADGVAHVPGRERLAVLAAHGPDLEDLARLLVAADDPRDTAHAVRVQDVLDGAGAAGGDHDHTVRAGQMLDDLGHPGEERRVRRRDEGVLQLAHHLLGHLGGRQRLEPVRLGEVEEGGRRRELVEPVRAERLDEGGGLIIQRVGDDAVEVEHDQLVLSHAVAPPRGSAARDAGRPRAPYPRAPGAATPLGGAGCSPSARAQSASAGAARRRARQAARPPASVASGR